MRRRGDFNPDATGQYSREIGWKPDAEGRRLIQHRFRLGTSRATAEIALRRLEQLWKMIEDEHEGSRASGRKPVWDDLALKVGKAIAKGAAVFSAPRNGASVTDYALALEYLQRRFGFVIAIQMDDQNAIDDFNKQIDEQERFLERAARSSRAFQIGNGTTAGPTLHQALDAYAGWIKVEFVVVTDDGKRLTDWGVAQIANVFRLKEHHPDLPLSSLGYSGLDEMFRHWRQRPMVKGRNKRMAKDSAEGHVYQLKQFVRWLHTSQEFAWRKPEDYDEIKTKVDADKEKSARRLATTQVDTYTLEELVLLSEYARPIERVLLLLGLNCAFGKMEVGTLRLNEVALHQQHPHAGMLGFESSDADSFIRRVRGKSGVYAEWLLWPQTVAALEWAIQRRMTQTKITKGRDAGKDISAKPDSVILLGRQGHSLVERTGKDNTNQQIPARWNALTDRIRKDHPEFRKLSFGKLRKTASSLVRRLADGETAGVFLAHGQPVETDDLLEVYTDRPFAKVFDALRRVGEYLQPMFDAAPSDPFSETAVSRSLNISLGTVKEIKRLRAEGVGPTEIARKLGVSRWTVYYHAPV